MSILIQVVRPYTPGGGGAWGVAERLTPRGLYFYTPGGALHVRRSITGFCAPKRFALGDDSVLAYLDWVARMGFTEIRVFSRVDWTGPPGSGVESGWEYNEWACERTLQEAAARGLHVEVVAHTGPPPGWSVQQMADHLARVDALCQRYPNALLECWNEPQQNGGHQLVQDVLARYSPKTPGWASGVYDPTPYTPSGWAGFSLTYHSPRKAEWSRCFKDVYEYQTGDGPNVKFTPPYLGPCMQDEPPQVEQTIRDFGVEWAADDWRAYAAGSAFFACGATMHSNPTFQQCTVPTDPGVIACVRAFIAGFGDVPLQPYSGYSGALQPTPGPDPGSRRYQRDGADGGRYEICVRPYSFRRVG